LAIALFTVGASARAPQPLVPTALVEDVTSTTVEVEFMDYVGSGQVIKLAPRDVLVLSYLKSCEHETITGGSVVVGTERSEVKDGKVVRAKVPCDGGKMKLSSQQAASSGAAAFRLQSANISPTLFAQTPVVQLPKTLASGERTLVIQRMDRRGSRFEVKLADEVAGGEFYDLTNAKVRLATGGVYKASLGEHELTFRIDATAKAGKTPVVSRLLRFQ